MKADYYSGALAGHALDQWTGWWCELFLLPDRRVVVIHQESTFIRCETHSAADALADSASIGFADDQQAAREAFERRLRAL